MHVRPVSRGGLAWSRDERVALAGLAVWGLVTAGWWALALWPVANGPEWLERTRYVCFGVAGSGLPDAGGWVGLVGSPLGMLAVLLVGWRCGVARLGRRLRASPALGGAAAGLLTAAIIAGGLLVRAAHARAATPLPEPVAMLAVDEHPRLDRDAPPLALLAHDGVRRSLADLRGRPVLVTFAFGHCETVCPIIVRHVLAARTALAPTDRAPAVLVVTVDPWRDVSSRLPYVARAWSLPDRDAWVLGGDVAAVEATLDAWQVPRSRDPRTGDVTHPPLVYVIDRDGRIAFATTGGADVIRGLVERI